MFGDVTTLPKLEPSYDELHKAYDELQDNSQNAFFSLYCLKEKFSKIVPGI